MIEDMSSTRRSNFTAARVNVTSYVCGAMFNTDLTKVALIRKSRPAWQAGKLNLVGGHVEQDESFIEAMVREFREETGVSTANFHWTGFASLESDRSLIKFYAAVGDLTRLKTTTDEAVFIVNTADIAHLEVVPNLLWIIPVAQQAIRTKETKGSIFVQQFS